MRSVPGSPGRALRASWPLLAIGAFAAWASLPDGAAGPSLVVCPFHWLTGLFCTGCGATRATGALLRGDVAQALAYNPIAAALIPIALLAAFRHAVTGLRGREAGPGPTAPWVGRAVLVLVIVFTVARNLPWEAFAPLRPHQLERGEGRGGVLP